MPIVMHDRRSSYPIGSKLFRDRKNFSEDLAMSSSVEAILGAIEELKNSIAKSNEDLMKSMFEIQREQLNVRRELVSIQREEMNLKVDAIKNFREVAKNDDLDFLKNLDVLDNEYLDKSIERAKKIQELHNEAIFK